jgi:hypothetical protein
MATLIQNGQRLVGLSPNALSALYREGIETLEEAAAKPDEILLAMKGFGKTDLIRLREWEKDPSSPILPPRRKTVDKDREERIFRMYTAFRSQGKEEATALNQAIREVDAVTERLREGAA